MQKLINYEFNFIKILFYIFFFQVALIFFAYFIFTSNFINLKTIILLLLIFFTVLISWRFTKNLYSYEFIYVSILIFFIVFFYPRFISFALLPNFINTPYPLEMLTEDIDNFLLFVLASLPFIFSACYFAEIIQKNLISKINFRFNFLNFKPKLECIIILFTLSVIHELLFLFYIKTNPFSNIELDKLHYFKMLLKNLINVDTTIFLVTGLILISNYKHKFILYFFFYFIYYIILACHFSKGGILRIDLMIIFQFFFLYKKKNFSIKLITTFFLVNLILAPVIFSISKEFRNLNFSIGDINYNTFSNLISNIRNNNNDAYLNRNDAYLNRNDAYLNRNENYLEKKINKYPKLKDITLVATSIFDRLGVVDYPILIIKNIKSSQFQDIDDDFTFGNLVKRVINVAPGFLFKKHTLKEERLLGYVIMGYDKTSIAQPVNYNTEPTTLWGSAYMYGNFYFGLIIIFFLFLISFFCFYFLKNINNKNVKIIMNLFLFMGIYGLFGSFGLDGHIIKLIIIGVQICIFFLMLYVFNKFWGVLAFKKLINLFKRF